MTCLILECCKIYHIFCTQWRLWIAEHWLWPLSVCVCFGCDYNWNIKKHAETIQTIHYYRYKNKKNPKKFPKNPQKIPKNILKICNKAFPRETHTNISCKIIVRIVRLFCFCLWSAWFYLYILFYNCSKIPEDIPIY